MLVYEKGAWSCGVRKNVKMLPAVILLHRNPVLPKSRCLYNIVAAGAVDRESGYMGKNEEKQLWLSVRAFVK